MTVIHFLLGPDPVNSSGIVPGSRLSDLLWVWRVLGLKERPTRTPPQDEWLTWVPIYHI